MEHTLTAREKWALVCAFDYAMNRLFYAAETRRDRYGCAATAIRKAQLDWYDAAQALGARGLGELMEKVSAMAAGAAGEARRTKRPA